MDEHTGLEQMICFELHAASRAMTALYRSELDAAGLTYPQFIALRVINQRGTVRVSDLGAALGLDSGTLSPLLKRLEEQGLTLRERGHDDKRTVWTQLSPKGTLLYDRLADLPARVRCNLDLSDADLTELHRLLGRVRAATAAPATSAPAAA